MHFLLIHTKVDLLPYGIFSLVYWYPCKTEIANGRLITCSSYLACYIFIEALHCYYDNDMNRHNIYSLVLAILEQLALAAAVLWVLPEIGISIPVWGLLLMMVALCAYSILSYRLGKKTMERSPLVWPAIGSKGRATTPLAPSGYARIGTELWKASSTGADIDRGAEIVIVRVEGTQLFVTGRNDINKAKNGWVVLP